MMSRAKVFLAYDKRMELHEDPDEETREYQFERPERLVFIYRKLMELQERLIQYHQMRTRRIGSESDRDGDDEKEKNKSASRYENHYYEYVPFIQLQCKAATRDMIELVHTPEFYKKLEATSTMTKEQLIDLPTIDCTLRDGNNDDDNAEAEIDNDMYFSKDTFVAALLAAGGVVECVNRVTDPDPDPISDGAPSNCSNSTSNRALAIVRPPGHHACQESVMGFCFFNSVVVAAKHAIHTQRASKVVILDWDIHHGNGTSDLTREDSNILYISLHRFGMSHGEKFFPGTGNYDDIGGGINPSAKGANLNIAWRSGDMGNAEYAAAMSELVLPLISAFGADLIIVSCGLDAANGDLIGDCSVYPSMYYMMTKALLETIGKQVPLVVALEGGYNLNVNAMCMEAVALALLDEEWDEDGTGGIDRGEAAVPQDRSNGLERGRALLQPFWDSSLEKNKRENVKRSAVEDINRSIRVMRNTSLWKDVDLKEIPLHVTNVARMTRSRSKKMNDTTNGKAIEASNEIVDIDLNFALQSLSI
uniref:histone deacetylase n=1 Tax=Chaetoceros debilis TaxID=122233 RepID=A0A7S3Q7P9_9STRA|mmetsp:Transcript_6668/g.9797  ORF Transcript_6668/g.9797 Transcript_6668/m.9797 type:complete len:534 (+) Transcript_6668:176-1777(+)|eukprot:CAMPEP_0194118236 /NCGR_PEP_ID=MMETSP0150-20130528/34600_1 /TAXON_ID=122233 /ORGANISM="Chaetoceros debilis, Strain MM31A-1" /LENGTH=533 /DNA_ID=CAMNT_0038809545 /DNA_START=125 /DNA_END=1726 /DNA_ORIENTATION=+